MKFYYRPMGGVSDRDPTTPHLAIMVIAAD